MANPNVSEILTTTLYSRTGKLADNVSANTALLMRLRERGNTRPVSGGATIRQELEYAENSTYMHYSGYEQLDISPSDVFTSAEFNWKQAAVAVSISGLEQLQNSGKEQLIDLLSSRVSNAERTFMNNLSDDIYSDGSGTSGKQIGGLQLLVADDPTTGTVGGIARASYSFWQNQLYDFSANSATPSSSTIQAALNSIYLSCTRNRDYPDLFVADNTYFTYFWASLQTNQRFTNPKLAEAGFQNLKFLNADVVFDGGQGGSAPSAHVYALNTNYIHFRPHRDRNIVPLDPDRFAVNQDAVVKLIGFAGNMTLSNAALQGVIIA